jgi:hypothetical protein
MLSRVSSSVRGGRPTFVTKAGMGLGMTTPPASPPAQRGFGGYCMRATCEVQDSLGCPVAKVSGYDKHPDVVKATQKACESRARALSGRRGPGLNSRQYRCMAAELVLLPYSSMECSGQVFWTMDGETKQLV